VTFPHYPQRNAAVATVAGDEAEQLLALMHLCEEPGTHRLKVPLATMDGAVAMCQVGESETRSARNGMFGILENYGVPAVWPVDVRVAMPAQPEPNLPEREQWPPGSVQFSRLSTITTAAARKLGATLYSHRMVLEECATCRPDGTYLSAKAPAAFLGGKWQAAAQYARGAREFADIVPLGLGVALSLRYEWTVAFGLGEGPRIRFLTDPAGARAAFRLRDLPPGRERRAALRHWVQAHNRRKHDDSEARAWVRRHLRGATEFVWNDMRCSISPPPYDVERLQAEAEAKRSEGGKSQRMPQAFPGQERGASA
jgi:hypothetical protein